MSPTLSYCGHEVYTHDRDHFYQSLFIPAANREAFFCFYALNLELVRIPSMVTEEMIGHIRYAWWQESLEEMLASGATKGHPVLQALASVAIPKELLMALVNVYREHYPAPVPEGAVENVALELVKNQCPQVERAWIKAGGIIVRHRRRQGLGRNGWLAFKLLICNL